MEPVTTPSFIDPRPANKVAAFLLYVLVFLYVGRSHEALALPIRFNLIFIVITVLFAASWLLKDPLKAIKQSVTLRRITYFVVWVALMVPFSRWRGGSVDALIAFLKVYAFLYLATALLIRFRLTKVAIFANVSGLLITLFLSIITDSSSVRVSTITSSYDPNEMALISVMVLPILFFAIKTAKPLMKGICLGGVAVCVIAVALSGSRGGMLGMLMVGAYILFVSSISSVKKILIVVLAAVVFVVAVPQENLVRLTKTFDLESDYNVTSKSGRINLWIADLKKIAKNPLNGVGLGQSTTLTEEEALSGAWMEAHNSYIEMALEGGLPGFFFLFTVMLIGLKRLRELRRTLDKRDSRMPLVNGLEGGLWGYFVCITFLSVAFYALSLFFFVMIEAVYKDIKGQYLVPVDAPSRPSPEPVKKRKRSYTMR